MCYNKLIFGFNAWVIKTLQVPKVRVITKLFNYLFIINGSATFFRKQPFESSLSKAAFRMHPFEN